MAKHSLVMPYCRCPGWLFERRENMKSNRTNSKIFTNICCPSYLDMQNPIDSHENHKLCIKLENDAGSCYNITHDVCCLIKIKCYIGCAVPTTFNVNWCLAGLNWNVNWYRSVKCNCVLKADVFSRHKCLRQAPAWIDFPFYGLLVSFRSHRREHI